MSYLEIFCKENKIKNEDLMELWSMSAPTVISRKRTPGTLTVGQLVLFANRFSEEIIDFKMRDFESDSVLEKAIYICRILKF